MRKFNKKGLLPPVGFLTIIAWLEFGLAIYGGWMIYNILKVRFHW